MIRKRLKSYDKVIIVYPTSEKKLEYGKYINEKLSNEEKIKVKIIDMYEACTKMKAIIT